LVEQLTLNQRVWSSSLQRPTKEPFEVRYRCQPIARQTLDLSLVVMIIYKK
jgi:hypothetical protein